MGKLLHAERLDGVDLRLAGTIRAAVATLPFDCTISEGVRSKEACMVNFGKGRTPAECTSKGVPAKYSQPGVAKVTWLSHPLGSCHLTGRAVDVYPLLPDGRLDAGREGMGRFDQLYHAMMAQAARIGVRLRYGGDWNENGKLRETGETDSPHFEIAA